MAEKKERKHKLQKLQTGRNPYTEEKLTKQYAPTEVGHATPSMHVYFEPPILIS